MFTGVRKLKISSAECGFEWKRKSTYICVCWGLCWEGVVAVCLLICIFSKHSASRLSHQCVPDTAWTKNVHKPWIHLLKKEKSKVMILATVCLVGFVLCLQIIGLWWYTCSCLEEPWLQQKRITWKRLILTAHYPLWQIHRIGKVLCRSHIENHIAKATAREDAGFVRD